MVSSILVVCTGNICRSPLGEGMLQSALAEGDASISIASVGIAAVAGAPAHPEVLKIAAEKGLDISTHIARQATQLICHDAEMILVMEKMHAAWLSTRYPELHGRVFLFGKWLKKQEIPDPIGQNRDYFQRVGAILEHAAVEWKRHLI